MVICIAGRNYKLRPEKSTTYFIQNKYTLPKYASKDILYAGYIRQKLINYASKINLEIISYEIIFLTVSVSPIYNNVYSIFYS